jgi:signal peptidase I
MDRAKQSREGIILNLAVEVLRTFGELRFAALGASMLPAIFPGDTLIVRRETARSARRGDVVLFFREGRFCAHRLVDKMEEGGRLSLITRGDALCKNDPPLAENELLGRVTAVVRGWKRIELGEQPAASEVLLRWAVRRSGSAVKWLLRWHSFRTRLAQNSGGAFAEVQPKTLECV